MIQPPPFSNVLVSVTNSTPVADFIDLANTTAHERMRLGLPASEALLQSLENTLYSQPSSSHSYSSVDDRERYERDLEQEDYSSTPSFHTNETEGDDPHSTLMSPLPVDDEEEHFRASAQSFVGMDLKQFDQTHDDELHMTRPRPVRGHTPPGFYSDIIPVYPAGIPWYERDVMYDPIEFDHVYRPLGPRTNFFGPYLPDIPEEDEDSLPDLEIIDHGFFDDEDFDDLPDLIDRRDEEDHCPRAKAQMFSSLAVASTPNPSIVTRSAVEVTAIAEGSGPSRPVDVPDEPEPIARPWKNLDSNYAPEPDKPKETWAQSVKRHLASITEFTTDMVDLMGLALSARELKRTAIEKLKDPATYATIASVAAKVAAFIHLCMSAHSWVDVVAAVTLAIPLSAVGLMVSSLRALWDRWHRPTAYGIFDLDITQALSNISGFFISLVADVVSFDVPAFIKSATGPIRTFSILYRGLKDFSQLLSGLANFVYNLSETFVYWAFGELSFLQFTRYRAAKETVTSFADALMGPKAMDDATFIRGKASCLQRFAHIAEQVTVDPAYKKEADALQAYYDAAVEYHSTRSTTAHSRQRPVVVWLYGPPGAGKTTTAIYELPQLVAGMGCIPVVGGNHVFRCPIDTQSEYWEGWRDQFAVLINDPCFTRDTEPNTAAMSEIQRIAEDAPYPVNMAFKGKGVTFINPEMVMVTTMTPDFTLFANIAYPPALRRRVDFWVAFDKDGNLSLSKFDPDSWARLSSTPVTSTQLAALILEARKGHAANYKKFCDMRTNIVKATSTDLWAIAARDNGCKTDAEILDYVLKHDPSFIEPPSEPKKPLTSFAGPILALIGAALSAAGAYAIYSYYTRNEVEDILVEEAIQIAAAQSARPGDRTTTARAIQIKPAVQIATPRPVAQSADVRDISNAIMKNLWTLRANDRIGTPTKVLMLGGRVGLVPTHWALYNQSRVSALTAQLIRGHEVSVVSFDEIELVPIDGIDITMLRFPNSVPEAGNIVNQFTHELAVAYDRGALITRDASGNPLTSWFTNITTIKGFEYDDPDGKPIKVARAFVASGCSSPGDCISPWVTTVAGRNVIFGLHIAAIEATGKTHSIPFPIGMARGVLEYFDAAKAKAQGFEAVKRLSPKEALHMPSKSADIESGYYTFVKEHVTKMPANMVPFHPDNRTDLPRISPAELGWARIQNQGVAEPHPSHLCRAATLRTVSFLPPRASLRSIDVHVALNGDPSRAYMGPLDRSTSGGWDPLIQVTGDKAIYLIETGGLFCLSEKGVDAYVRAKLSNRDGIRPVYSFCPKQEILPIEKVKAGRTRFTHNMQFGELLYGRELLLPLIAKIMEQRDTSPFKVGINVHDAQQWAMLATWLKIPQARLMRILAGDFGNFDGSQCKALIEEVLKVFELYYGADTEEYKYIARHVRSRDVAFINQLFINFEYSNPTGWILTTIWNCVVVLWVDSYAVCALVADHPEDPIADEDLSAFALYGDDHVKVVPLTSKFTWEFWLGVCTSWGLKLTAADKISETGESKPDEVTFLQRKLLPAFGRNTGLYAAPLTMEHLYNIAAWRHRTMSEADHFVTTPSSLGIEAFHLALCYPNDNEVHFKRILAPFSAVNFMRGYPFLCGTFREHYSRWSNMHGSGPVPLFRSQVLTNSVVDFLHNADEWVVCEAATVLETLAHRAQAQSLSTGKGVQVGNQSTDQPTLKIQPPVSLPSIFKASTGMQSPFATSMLGKKAVIANTFLDGTVSPMTNFFVMDPLAELLTKGYTQQLLTSVANFRCDVEVTISIVGTAFVSGLIQVAYQSNCAPTHFPMICTPIQASTLDNCVIDLNASSSTTFILKYDSPYYWMKLGAYVPGSVGSFRMDCLLPVVTAVSDGITRVPITIEARMVNIEVDGAQDTSLAQRAVAQSLSSSTYSRLKYGNLTIIDDTPLLGGNTGFPLDEHPDQAETIWPADPNHDFAPDPQPVAVNPTMMETASKAASAVVKTLPTDRVHPTAIATQAISKLPPAQEQKEGSSHLASNIFTSVGALAGGASVIPILAPFTVPIAAISSAIGGILRLFGKDMPLSDAALMPFVSAPGRGNSLMIGSRYAETIGTSMSTRCASGGNILRDRKDYNLTQAHFARPFICYSGEPLLLSGAGQLVAPSIPVSPMRGYALSGYDQWHPMRCAASCHTFWRGSMRYKIKFVTNAFTRFKIRIVWSPQSTTVYPDTALVFSHVIDVSGPTEYDFVIPWRGEVFAPTFTGDGSGNNGYLTMFLETDIALPNTSSTSRIYFVMWQAGGSDLMILRPNLWTSPSSSRARAMSIANMEEEFEKGAEFFVNGHMSVPSGVYDSVFTNYRSYLHMFTNLNGSIIIQPQSVLSVFRINLSALLPLPWFYMSACFRGCVGSFHLRVTTISQTENAMLYVSAVPYVAPTPSDLSYSGVAPFPVTKEVCIIPVHIPMDTPNRYYTSDSWDSSDTSTFSSPFPDILFQWTGLVELYTTISFAVGDDFSFTIPSACAPGQPTIGARTLKQLTL
jgi:hypothetical protein